MVSLSADLVRRTLACAAVSSVAFSAPASVRTHAPAPGERGGETGLAILAGRALTCAPDRAHAAVENAVILVRDGRVEAVGPAGTVDVPEGYAVHDAGDRWVCPGFVELHNHVAGMREIGEHNDMVYLANPGLRVAPTVQPGRRDMQLGVAGGVTTCLYIPGSGTNIGGQGILLKAGFERFEEMRLRDPGSMKLAQSGNPERWTVGVGRSFMNWNTRNVLRRGKAYAESWDEHDGGRGPAPEPDIQLEVFRPLFAKELQVSVHTQQYQVVLMTLTMLRDEFDLDAFIDHGSIGAWRLGALAEERGVAAIVGPRVIDTISRGFMNWGSLGHEGFRGLAAGYQALGHTAIGFNTDSPNVPQEELFLQASMAVRFGFDDAEMDALRGLTIVPARVAGIADRVGSLEPGKDADLLVVAGDPIDPRSVIDLVLIEGRVVYDARREGRRF